MNSIQSNYIKVTKDARTHAEECAAYILEYMRANKLSDLRFDDLVIQDLRTPVPLERVFSRDILSTYGSVVGREMSLPRIGGQDGRQDVIADDFATQGQSELESRKNAQKTPELAVKKRKDALADVYGGAVTMADLVKMYMDDKMSPANIIAKMNADFQEVTFPWVPTTLFMRMKQEPSFVPRSKAEARIIWVERKGSSKPLRKGGGTSFKKYVELADRIDGKK